MNRKQEIEMMAVHRALIEIRMLATDIYADTAGAGENVRALGGRIYAIADAFHEVPRAIAKGEDLDPVLFAQFAAEAGIPVNPGYLADAALSKGKTATPDEATIQAGGNATN